MPRESVRCNHVGRQCGYGMVYELTPTGSGWQETVLHNFAGGANGENSATGVVFDKAGNLYGATEYGGAVGSKYCPTGCGTIYQLAHSGNVWNYSVLHNFQYYPDGNDPGGSHQPGSGLAFDAQGNLYGTTYDGGSLNCPEPTPYSGGQSCGVVFKMTQSGDAWNFTTLYTFQNADDGYAPTSTCRPLRQSLPHQLWRLFHSAMRCLRKRFRAHPFGNADRALLLLG
jgi:hypothetical protein